MQVYVGVKKQLHAFIILVSDKSKWLASRLGRQIPEKETQVHTGYEICWTTAPLKMMW